MWTRRCRWPSAYVLETGKIALAGKAGALLADKRIQESYLGIA
jgi:ABC-type branched-subunit amino acid transport system ATPase component